MHTVLSVSLSHHPCCSGLSLEFPLPPSHHMCSIVSSSPSFPDSFAQSHGPHFGFAASINSYATICIFLTFGNFNPQIGSLGNNKQS